MAASESPTPLTWIRWGLLLAFLLAGLVLLLRLGPGSTPLIPVEPGGPP